MSVAVASPAFAAPPVPEIGAATVAPGESVQIQLSATDPDGDALTFAIEEPAPLRGTVGAVGPSQCSAGVCTAPVTYTASADAPLGEYDMFSFSATDGGDEAAYAWVDVLFACGAIISNGTVQLGVNCDGSLNNPNGPESSGGTTTVGLRYVPTNADGTGHSCDCEGWGVADATSGEAGFVNPAKGTENVTKVRFGATADTATSVMRVPGRFEVTHAYRPSALPNLYAVAVSIKNISGASTATRYRRVMDWEPEPTPFSEHTTMRKGNAPSLVATSNDGYASSNPLVPWANRLDVTGSNWSDAGPGDQGALFDFNFGSLAPGATRTFTTYYGAAPNEATAIEALRAVGAQAYSLGQPSTADGATRGTPNTFIFGFSNIGGVAPFPMAHAGAAGGPANTETPIQVTLSATHPTGNPLTFAVETPPTHGTLGPISDSTCTGTVAASCSATVTYTPDEGYVGDDSFLFRTSDGAGTASARMSLTVGGDATTTTYTGPATVQYSDAVTLQGKLVRTSGGTALASKPLTFRVGTQSTSAATNSSGVAAKSLTVLQQPGAAGQVHAEFFGGSGYRPSRQAKSFTIAKEDCTVDYTGPAVIGSNGTVELRAAVGEPDSRLGNRADKPVRFTLTDVDNGVSSSTTYDAVTNASGIATRVLTIPGGIARDVYLVKASFAGDQYYKACTSEQEVLAVSVATAKATGGGWISGTSYFGFNVLSASSGQLEVSGPSTKRFHATSVTSLTRSGRTLVWKGAGRMGTIAGHTYVATVEDNATSGVGKDKFKLVVRNSSGTAVYSLSGLLRGGNVKLA